MTEGESTGKRKESPVFFWCLTNTAHQMTDHHVKKEELKLPQKSQDSTKQKIFCLLLSPIVLPWHPDCPSPKDRKKISRLGDFLAKENDQAKKEDKTRKGYHWVRFSCYFKTFFLWYYLASPESKQKCGFLFKLTRKQFISMRQ